MGGRCIFPQPCIQKKGMIFPSFFFLFLFVCEKLQIHKSYRRVRVRNVSWREVPLQSAQERRLHSEEQQDQNAPSLGFPMG